MKITDEEIDAMANLIIDEKDSELEKISKEFEQFKESGELEEFKTKINDENISKYEIGELLSRLKDRFEYETTFKRSVLYIRNVPDNETKEREEQVYNRCLNLISSYEQTNRHREMLKEQAEMQKKQQERINKKLEIFRNSEEATDEEIEDFVENQKCSLTIYKDFTDVENEIAMIAHLITDKEVRNEYLSISDNLFNLKAMKEIKKKLADCNVEDDDLSEYLIKEDYSATDLKCILSFKNASDNVWNIYSSLSKYRKLRHYASYSKNAETNNFFHEVPLYESFSDFSAIDLEDFLDKFIENVGDGYTLRKDYKEIPTSTKLDFSDIFYDFTKLEKGVDMPFPIINDCIDGFRKGQLLGIGMLSNAGKTRFLVNLVTHLILNEDKKVLLILNETTKQDLQYSIFITALNNATVQEKYNISKTFAEKEFRNRQISDDEIYDVLEDIQEKIDNNLVVIITDSYTDSDLKNMIVQEHYRNKVDYIFYDTLKVSSESTNTTDDLKKTATLLSELAKKYNIFIGCSFQLTDETRKTTGKYNLDSSNIASSKQIYHVMSTVLFFKEMDKKDYSNYLYTTTENKTYNLKEEVRYYVCCLDKNRIGNKPKLLFQVDLDTNEWKEVGELKIK